jgi:uncharacterized protein (TIGR01440 family)
MNMSEMGKGKVRVNSDGTAELLAGADELLEQIKAEARGAINEILDATDIRAGQIFVVGCSSSEVAGQRIGKASVVEIAEAVFEGIYPILKEKGIYLAAQCCEHLNRAIIIEGECAERYMLDTVSVVPKPKAGGSFAATAYKQFSAPVAVEHIRAHAGIDIGGTLIGMQLREVAVPLRIATQKIGEANILCAYTRPKYIGGPRAEYK